MKLPGPGCVGGLHEVCVGVTDLDESIAYYQAFGCRPGERGELDAAAARALYGVDSPLRSVRLLHQQADQHAAGHQPGNGAAPPAHRQRGGESGGQPGERRMDAPAQHHHAEAERDHHRAARGDAVA